MQFHPMNYKLTIAWNGTAVLEANITATMARDVLTMFGANFVNADKAGYATPSLAEILAMSVGQKFGCFAFDNTGHAQYELERHA